MEMVAVEVGVEETQKRRKSSLGGLEMQEKGFCIFSRNFKKKKNLVAGPPLID